MKRANHPRPVRAHAEIVGRKMQGLYVKARRVTRQRAIQSIDAGKRVAAAANLLADPAGPLASAVAPISTRLSSAARAVAEGSARVARMFQSTDAVIGGSMSLESLELRQMLSASANVYSYTLIVSSDSSAANNQIDISYNASSNTVVTDLNGVISSFSASQISKIQVNGSDSYDNISIQSNITTPVEVDEFGSEADTISTGSGRATINGGNGADSINAGNGNDLITTGSRSGSVIVGSGNDTINASAGGDTIYLGSGADSVSGGSLNNTIIYNVTSNDTISNAMIESGWTSNYSNSSSSSSASTGSNSSSSASTSSSTASSSSSSSSSSTSSSTGSSSSSSGGTASSSAATGSSSTSSSSTSSSSSSSSNGLQAVITNDWSTNIIAGEAIQVKANSSNLNGGDPLTTSYQWSFGDSNGEYNNLQGFSAGHIYNTPGTYTISLTLTDASGDKATTSEQVNVASDTRSVIYVSPYGSDSNNGSSQSDPVQTLARADNLLTSNTKVLLQAGGTYDLSTYFNIGDLQNVEVSSYGSGAKPIVLWTGARDSEIMFGWATGAYGVVINNLTFDSVYTTDESESGMPYAIDTQGTNSVVENCTFLNVGYAINANYNPDGVLAQDNTAPSQADLRAYFIYETGENITLLGNNIAGSENEHDVRGIGSDVLLAYNTLANPISASESGAKNAINLQGGQWISVFNNTVPDTGGGVWFGPIQDQTVVSSISDIQVEDNDFGSFFQIQPGVHDIMIENNVLRRLAGENGFGIQGYDSSTGRYATDIRILNNTMISSGTYGTFLSIYNDAQGVTVENNLWVGNILYGVNNAAAIYIDGADFSSFTAIKNNIWPVNGGGYYGTYYYYLADGGYLTTAQAQAMGIQDIFQTVSSSALTGYSFILNGTVYGSSQSVS